MRDRKLSLRKETLSDLSSGDMQIVVGAYSGSCTCQATLRTCVTCVDTYTVATCGCPTGASCPCPTASGC